MEKKTNELTDETLDAVAGGGKKAGGAPRLYCFTCREYVKPDDHYCCPYCGKPVSAFRAERP